MNDLLALIAIKLIIVHGLDGHAVTVNSDMVTSLIAKRASAPRLLVNDRVACIINLADGKFLSVVETCDEVRRKMMEGAR